MTGRKLACRIGVLIVVISWGCAIAAFDVCLADTDNFPYPELLVTPSASERLAQEASGEGSQAWTQHAIMQTSALTTTLAGYMAIGDKGFDSDDDPDTHATQTYDAGKTAVVIGGGWLGITLIASALHRPYSSGMAAVKGLPAKTERQQLKRERLAEEYLNKPARLMARIKWLSILTNFGAGVYVAAEGSDDNTKTFGALSAVVAFGPLLFDHRWEEVSDLHEGYKKKIYGPLASASLMVNPVNGRLAPGVVFDLARW